MRRVRVIPIVMLLNGRAVITQKFRKPIYVGDPINAIKILNDKEVDEIIILDVSDADEVEKPNFDLIEKMASECFMPITYGGHVKNESDAARIINCGVEKISLNRLLYTNSDMVASISSRFGRQSIVASLDVKKDWRGRYQVVTHNARNNTGLSIEKVLSLIDQLGVGECLVTSVDRDGTMLGYDHELLKMVSNRLQMPVIAAGGASGVTDFLAAVRESGASAIAAGAMFFFKGNFNAVLVNYPDQNVLTTQLYSHLDEGIAP